MRKCMVSNGMSYTKSTLLARTAGLALAAGGLWLGGCDRDDRVADAVMAATIKLAAVSPGATGTATPAMDDKAYTEVISSLKAVAGQGGEGQQAAVDLLIARAQLGLAGQTAVETGELEQAALRSVTAARSDLQAYLSYSVQAGALSQFDPAPLLADLDKQITAREADLKKARQAKQDIDAQIAALKAQSQAKLDQAAAEHKIEAGLREQAIRGSSTEAAGLIADANKHRRIADGFDVEASTLDAQAAQIAPRSPEAQLLIDQLTNQRDQLGHGRNEVQKRDAANRQLATAARAEQAKAAEAVDAAVKAVVSAREGDLPKKYDDAAKQFADAAATAGKAAKANKTQSAMLVGEARHSLGDLNWARAQGIGSAAALLETLAAATPALPQQADYAKQASEARAAEKTALDAATEAFQAAKAAYEGANVKGEAAAKIEQVGKSLSEIILTTSGGSVDLRSDADKATASPPASAPAGTAAAADSAVAAADSPKATVDAMVAAIKAGRFEDVGGYLYIPDQATRDLTLASLKMLGKFQQLDDACKAKFGKALSDLPGSPTAAAKQSMMAGLNLGANGAGPELAYNVTGDTASATGPSLPEPLKFRRVNGKWLIDGTKPAGVDDQQMKVASAMIPVMAKALDGVIADVQAGKFKTIDEVGPALMGAIVPQGPGGGGGG